MNYFSGDDKNKILVGKEGIFSRFPFLSDRLHTMNHLISNRDIGIIAKL
jgi:hypothetical protein